jgi:rhodanese-related sulfurtransferase
MKTKDFMALILIVSLLSIPALFAVPKEEMAMPEIPRISVDSLKQLIEKNDKSFVIVDTRDSGSYEAGHIKGAINIYYDPNGDPQDRQLMLTALPMDKLVITYCDCTDDANSAKIADELYKLGYDKDKVKVLAGGSLKWVELKYPMVKKND